MISNLRWLVAPHFFGTEPGGDGNGAICEMRKLLALLNRCILDCGRKFQSPKDVQTHEGTHNVNWKKQLATP